MAHISADRVQETTTTTGTGAITLAGAGTGYRTFASVMAASDTCYYTIAGGSEWEVGLGTFNTTLTRTTVYASSNAGSLVNFSAGSKNVFLTAPARGIVEFEPNNSINMPVVAAEPSAPPAGNLSFYSRSIAGRLLPKIIGPSGIDTILQVGLSGNSVFMLAPQSGTTAPLVWGGSLTTAATMSVQQTIASANPWQATWRKRFQTSTTSGTVTGCRTAYTQWFRGNATGFGGFWFRAQFGQNINLNGSQCFVGLCASTGALGTGAGAVSALVNMIGVGFDTTDASTGNWQFYRNDGTGTATKVDLGATNAARNTTHGYDLIIFCPPGAATEIFVRIINLHSGATVLDTSYTTDLPAVNTGMAFKAECNNGAVSSATNIEVAKVYIETDY
jgi:hypothetical protein